MDHSDTKLGPSQSSNPLTRLRPLAAGTLAVLIRPLGARPVGISLVSMALLGGLGAGRAEAQCFECQGSIADAFMCTVDLQLCHGTFQNPDPGNPPICGESFCSFRNCRNPVVEGPDLDVLAEPDSEFTARLKFTVTAPWNAVVGDPSHPDYRPNGTLDMFWFQLDHAPIPNCEPAPPFAVCEYFDSDQTECYLERKDLTCDGAPYSFGVYSFRAQVCGGPRPCPFPPGGCGRWVDKENLSFTVTKSDLNCPQPRKQDCDCTCKLGASPGGAPGACGSACGGRKGPGAELRYSAGGAGSHPDFPGTAAWTPTLGRNWSHDYAQRIFLDPVAGNDSRVWLVTETATFREFWDLVGGEYLQVSPTDEYRTLHRTAGGWELHELDGTVHGFDAAGRWTATTDRNGNAKTACYDSEPACTGAGPLIEVTMPDARAEEFTYHPSGKLATITEVGIDGTSTLVWGYEWTGDDLDQVIRPDGTILEFFYEDPQHPGFMTRVELVPTSGPRRIEQGWVYDAQGNVIDTWRGATSPTDPLAVERWSFGFDDPILPRDVTVTDPLGSPAQYVVGRDSNSRKPRVERIEDDCPTCLGGPNSVLDYDDPDHPLLPTRITDGGLHVTEYEYDDHGRVSAQIEAVSSADERRTDWQYHATYPGLVIEQRRESVLGGTNERVTTWVRDALGNATTVREVGFEDGAAYLCETDTVFTAAGVPETVDPPGFDGPDAPPGCGVDDPPGTVGDDVTSYTYDPARGNLLVATRTNPLGHGTALDYDPFNRRTIVTDANGVTTETIYDALDRVRYIIERSDGSIPGTWPPQAADLVTEHVYDGYGDLVRTILPRENVIEYGYDHAGRLETIERKPDAATHGDRLSYTLNEVGARILEERQRWDVGLGDWVTESSTAYDYSTRCVVDKVIEAPGAPEERVTEYAYDCDGNLTQVWDGNHPRGSTPDTVTYTYDALHRQETTSVPWDASTFAVTTYDYDVQDHLISLTDAEGNVNTYDYSDRGLMTEEASPASGTTQSAYNAHGELVNRIDAKGTSVIRTVDALDRVTFEDYPDPALDTTFVYDDPAVAFSLGQLTRVSRNISTRTYEYDRFGRTARDGDLRYTFDENGNVVEIEAFGALGADAVYTYDFADRQATLTLEPPSGGPVPVVTSTSYEPFGPLASLGLANGVTETRAHDRRYEPEAITAETASATLLDWSYSVDGAGNIEAIDDLLAPANDRSFAYRDFHYFLTCAAGPWAPGADCSATPPTGNPLLWTYDQIGNRLSETRGGVPIPYTYTSNGSGNTPRLIQAGSQTFDYDPAGRLIEILDGGTVNRFAYDDAGRLTEVYLGSGKHPLDLTYDGLGHLRSTYRGPVGVAEFATYPLYDSSGQIEALTRQPDPSGILDKSVLHRVYSFAGRPVAVRALSWFDPVVPVLRFYTTDHLGTPVLVTDPAGAAVWSGGFEPFGADYASAGSDEIFLRFPGQWEDESWVGPTDGALYYNLNRWYMTGAGRYTRPDPLGFRRALGHAYSYTEANPLVWIDPLGLCRCNDTDECPGGEWIYEGWGFSGVLAGGISIGRGTYTCKSNRRAKAPVKARCWLLGAMLGGGIGLEGSTPLLPSACGCNEADLLGEQEVIVGSALVFSATVSGCGKGAFSIGPRTLTVGLAKSAGAGLAVGRCETTRRWGWWDWDYDLPDPSR